MLGLIEKSMETQEKVVKKTKAEAKEKAKVKVDFDSPWKIVIKDYFEDFMLLFWPEKHKEIAWEKGYHFLDKELAKITRNAVTGNKHVDKLVELYLKNGQETWILFHIEIQRGRDSYFQERMFIYAIRLFDTHRKPIVSLAILIDGNENWRPSGYKKEFWDCSVEMKFPIIKLLDFRSRVPELETSNNRFAPVVLAQLAAIENKTAESRLVTKIALTKHLLLKKWPKKDIMNLYVFLDWVMALPELFELEYHKEIDRFEEEKKMEYVTTAERIGIRKGLEQGILQGEVRGERKGERTILIMLIKRKFGDIPSHYNTKIKNADSEQLLCWAEKILDAKSLFDLLGE